MKKSRLLTGLALASLVAGAYVGLEEWHFRSAYPWFFRADSFELVTLDPLPYAREDGSTESARLFGWRILDSKVVSGSDRDAIWDLVVADLRASPAPSGADCAFSPKHAIRFRDGEEDHAVLLCYFCREARLESTLRGNEPDIPIAWNEGRVDAYFRRAGLEVLPIKGP